MRIKAGSRRPGSALLPWALFAGLLATMPWGRRASADEGLGSPALQEALLAAATVPGARVDVVAVDRPSGDCVTSRPDARVEVSRPIEGSDRVAIKLIGTRAHGASCEVWAWARIRMFAQVPVAARAIRAGETLGAGTVRSEEREIKPGHIPAVLGEGQGQGQGQGQGMIAERPVGAGQMIERSAVRAPGLKAGASVRVLIVSGVLAIEEAGRAVPCGRESTCAILPSGKHVEGIFADGRLTVMLP